MASDGRHPESADTSTLLYSGSGEKSSGECHRLLHFDDALPFGGRLSCGESDTLYEDRNII